MVTALQRACPEISGESLIRELRMHDPEIAESVLPVLANELAALFAPVVLVLDDYHVITDRRCHDQVRFLLLHLPPSAQLVLITRTDPPLPLARIRAAGEMVEIRPVSSASRRRRPPRWCTWWRTWSRAQRA